MNIAPSHPLNIRAQARYSRSELCLVPPAFSHSQLLHLLKNLELPKQTKEKTQAEEQFALVSGQLNAPFPKTGFLPCSLRFLG